MHKLGYLIRKKYDRSTKNICRGKLIGKGVFDKIVRSGKTSHKKQVTN